MGPGTLTFKTNETAGYLFSDVIMKVLLLLFTLSVGILRMSIRGHRERIESRTT